MVTYILPFEYEKLRNHYGDDHKIILYADNMAGYVVKIFYIECMKSLAVSVDIMFFFSFSKCRHF